MSNQLDGSGNFEGVAIDINRGTGSLVGLAVGDAVGIATAYKAPGTFDHIMDMVGVGPFEVKLLAGQWTDGVALALAMAEALAQCGEFKPHAIMNAWVSWLCDGSYSCTGTLQHTSKVTEQSLRRYIADGSQPYAGTQDGPDDAAPLMRLCPVVIRYAGDDGLSDYVTLSSLLTHGSNACVIACSLFAGRLLRAYRGEDKRSVLREYNREVGCGTNEVVDAYHTALMCFDGTDNFRDAILMAANLGHSAGTSAAITGQLAGAFYGIEGIPEEWLDRLAWRDRFIECAEELCKQSPG